MLLPKGFQPLAAVVSDFHLRTPPEEACERYLHTRGERRGVSARVWDWMVRVEKNVELAGRLLVRLRDLTDTLISLGDHYSHVVNVYGLAEQRARLSAVIARQLFHRYQWRVIHVPSDHDLGVPHVLTGLTGKG